MKDLIRASLSSLLDYENSVCWVCGKNECPDLTPPDASIYSLSFFRKGEPVALSDILLCGVESDFNCLSCLFCDCFELFEFIGFAILETYFKSKLILLFDVSDTN
jgi:hypothetical protein